MRGSSVIPSNSCQRARGREIWGLFTDGIRQELTGERFAHMVGDLWGVGNAGCDNGDGLGEMEEGGVSKSRWFDLLVFLLAVFTGLVVQSAPDLGDCCEFSR